MPFFYQISIIFFFGFCDTGVIENIQPIDSLLE